VAPPVGRKCSGADMFNLDVLLTISAGTVLVLGVVGGFVKNRLWLSEPANCLIVGAGMSLLARNAAGPDAASDLPLSWLKEAAHLTLGIAVMGAAMRLPGGYWRSCCCGACRGG
jgi:sodium/hydrogen antiporter